MQGALQRNTIEPMNASEQSEWIARHIPHRVRAAVARLPMQNSLLQVEAAIGPVCRTEQDETYWRCATDSIWEGRLAATRWLIEFIGIKRHENGKPTECNKKKGSKDVRIDDLNGGVLFDTSNPDAQILADVWKGCSQASSHATNEYNHPRIGDRKAIPENSPLRESSQPHFSNVPGQGTEGSFWACAVSSSFADVPYWPPPLPRAQYDARNRHIRSRNPVSGPDGQISDLITITGPNLLAP